MALCSSSSSMFLSRALFQATRRLLSSPSSSPESHMIGLLKAKFPGATDIAVVDVSGGCGSMYEVFVEAPEFHGVRMVKQHRMVTDALREEIKDMHGLRISTAATPKGCGGGGK